MSRFGDLMGGKKEPTPVPAPAPTPEPVVEEVVESEVDTGGSAESVLENMSKDELEDYGRVLGIEWTKDAVRRDSLKKSFAQKSPVIELDTRGSDDPLFAL